MSLLSQVSYILVGEHVTSSKFQQKTPREMKPSWQTCWVCCNLLVLAAICKLRLTVDYQLGCKPLAQPQTVSLATYKTSSSESVSSACYKLGGYTCASIRHALQKFSEVVPRMLAQVPLLSSTTNCKLIAHSLKGS